MVTERLHARNIQQLAALAAERLDPGIRDYLDGGADDTRTLEANSSRFARFGIRARRLVDVSSIDTSVEVLGECWTSPVSLAPVGYQAAFHEQAESAVARAAHARGQRFIASTVSSHSIETICAAAPGSWFQLYPTANRDTTRALLDRAEAAGCPVVMLTVDLPTLGNREDGIETLTAMLADGRVKAGNFEKLEGGLRIDDPSLDWTFVEWIRKHCSMRLVLKGIVTHEDARLAVEHGVDGVVVSNHGGRQEESDRASIDCLAEVVEEIDRRCAVLLDGGIRRGTDVFKALALGADAVCIGRAYVWGLAAAGEAGVGHALDLLQEELVRIMQLAGTVSIDSIGRAHVHVESVK